MVQRSTLTHDYARCSNHRVPLTPMVQRRDHALRHVTSLEALVGDAVSFSSAEGNECAERGLLVEEQSADPFARLS